MAGAALERTLEMIQASPNLRSLDLTILTHYSWNATPWADSSSSLGSIKVFRDLHTYRVGGTVDPNWVSFFETPGTNEFRQFLELHPHLHTVNIASTLLPNEYIGFDPEVLASLFPSLRHFEGPAFLCEALVQSTLATQLETLGISEETFNDNEMVSRVAGKMRRLPELRTLMYMFDGTINDNDFPIVEVIMGSTPKLTHLFVSHISVNQFGLLPDALKQTPDLQVLSTSFKELLRDSSNGSYNNVLLRLVKPLAVVCPRLEYLYSSWSTVGRYHWKIARKRGEAVKVRSEGLRENKPRYWEDD
ncbi:hypothetical protein BDV93DRAFT_520628 [Ceratobasidium sp. AG-I]|nr:hypothetical protein BDV93DRAFT_520628 [Ceratobasidium sp. AG-I]